MSGYASAIPWAKAIVDYVALTNIYVDFLRGVIDTRAVIYLISLTSNKKLMHENANTPFQKWFSIVATVIIVIAATAALATAFIKY